MRIRFLIAVSSVSFFTFGAAVQACSGKSEDAEATDAGTDAYEAGKDATVVDAADSAPPCDPNKDFLKDIPDASIADGATTTGICLGCMKTKCASEIKACAKDCPCQNLASGSLECVLKAANQAAQLACASPFFKAPKATQDIGQALLFCSQGECNDECAASSFDPDAGDAEAGP